MSVAYITIGTNDMARSRRFRYDAGTPHLGGQLEIEYADQACCYVMRGEQRIWIGKPQDGLAAVAGNGIMPALPSATAKRLSTLPMPPRWRTVAAMRVIPDLRPLYGPDFYGAYARDPEGNKMSFVHFGSSQS